MHFSTIASIITAATIAVAVPANVARPAYTIEKRQLNACAGQTYSNPQCCATDVLGVADLNCAAPPSTPVNQTFFVEDCAAIGQQARCCLLPILGQAILCGEAL